MVCVCGGGGGLLTLLYGDAIKTCGEGQKKIQLYCRTVVLSRLVEKGRQGLTDSSTARKKRYQGWGWGGVISFQFCPLTERVVKGVWGEEGVHHNCTVGQQCNVINLWEDGKKDRRQLYCSDNNVINLWEDDKKDRRQLYCSDNNVINLWEDGKEDRRQLYCWDNSVIRTCGKMVKKTGGRVTVRTTMLSRLVGRWYKRQEAALLSTQQR